MKIFHIYPTVEGGMLQYVNSLFPKIQNLSVQNEWQQIFIQIDTSVVNTKEQISIERVEDSGTRAIYKVRNALLDLKNPLLECTEKGFEEAFLMLLDDERPDVAHFHSAHGIPFSLIQLAHIRGVKTILSIHDAGALCYRNSFFITEKGEICTGPLGGFNCTRCGAERNELTTRYNYVLDVLNNYTDCLIAVSEYIREIHKLYGIKKDIKLIKTGTDYKQTSKLKKTSKPVRILFTGGLSHRKGLLVLLEALRGIDTDKYILDVYGYERSSREIFEAKISPAYPDLNLQFLGKYEREEVGKILDEHDLVLLPSTGVENAPIMIQEALARRVPCICSSSGGMKEYIDNWLTGVIFENGNISQLNSILKELIDNPQKIEQLSANIDMKEWKTFSDVAQEHIRVYLELANCEKGFYMEPIYKEYYKKCKLELLSFSNEDIAKYAIAKADRILHNQVCTYIFGTGNFADLVLKNLVSTKLQPKGFFDNNQQLWGKNKNGILIEKPVYKPGTKVIIASSWTKEINSQLLDLGYKESDIIKIYNN